MFCQLFISKLIEFEDGSKKEKYTSDPKIDTVFENNSLLEHIWCQWQLPDTPESVLIIDAMVIVQGIKKTPGMKKMKDFSDVFCKKLSRR